MVCFCVRTLFSLPFVCVFVSPKKKKCLVFVACQKPLELGSMAYQTLPMKVNLDLKPVTKFLIDLIYSSKRKKKKNLVYWVEHNQSCMNRHHLTKHITLCTINTIRRGEGETMVEPSLWHCDACYLSCTICLWHQHRLSTSTKINTTGNKRICR